MLRGTPRCAPCVRRAHARGARFRRVCFPVRTSGGRAAVAGLFAAALLAATPDPYPRRVGIDVESYRFELTLRDDTDEIAGRATIVVRFTAGGVTELPLDLTSRADGAGRGMEVLEVAANESRAAYIHEDDLLTIRLPQPSVKGERATFEVVYRGVPADGLQIGPNKHGERTFFSDNWPNKARNWLPTIDHIAEKAACEFVVTAPAHYQVVSNGLLVEETDVSFGSGSSGESRLSGESGLSADAPSTPMRRTHWKQSAPISPWLFVIGVARFAVHHNGHFQGKPVQTWVYARDRDAGFHDFAVPTKDVLAFYEARVGPFAYEKLANVTSPATGGGMEAATALMYGENSVTGERSVRWRNVVIHEIAHQWFGNAVTESDWDDVWLSEGFATYFTLLFREHAYGRDDFVSGLRQAAERVWRWYDDNPEYRIVHDDLDDMARHFEDAPRRFQLAAVVAEYAELLRESYWARDGSLKAVSEQAARIRRLLPDDLDAAEFAALTARAAQLARE